MKCPYCDSEFEIDALRQYEKELSKSKAEDRMEWKNNSDSGWEENESKNLNVYICNTCGGEIIADENTAATSCPYCDNPIVISEKIDGTLRPNYIIPFKVNKKAAKEGLKKHIEGKKLLPRVFKQENHIDEIKGVYVPFWVFDADVNANMSFRGEIIRTWSDSDYHYTEIKYYSIIRSGDISFAHVPVDGSSKMEDDLMESVEPFDFKDAVEFKTEYVAGYLADKYDVSSEVSIARANERIKKSTENAFENTISGYSNLRIENSNINLNNGNVSYVLYPVWILNTTWRKKKYVFAMNGQTGKFVGNMPVDYSIFWKYYAVLTIILSMLTYVILWIVL